MTKDQDDAPAPHVFVADYGHPLDIDTVFPLRFNPGGGHGNLNGGRQGYVRLRRNGWDDLHALVDMKQLTSNQAFLTVALLTRAGYHAGRVGVVLGNDKELAGKLGISQNHIGVFWERLVKLGIGHRLVLEDGGRAGWRFHLKALLWLAGGEQDFPAPDEVAFILRPVPNPFD